MASIEKDAEWQNPGSSFPDQEPPRCQRHFLILTIFKVFKIYWGSVVGNSNYSNGRWGQTSSKQNKKIRE